VRWANYVAWMEAKRKGNGRARMKRGQLEEEWTCMLGDLPENTRKGVQRARKKGETLRPGVGKVKKKKKRRVMQRENIPETFVGGENDHAIGSRERSEKSEHTKKST